MARQSAGVSAGVLAPSRERWQLVAAIAAAGAESGATAGADGAELREHWSRAAGWHQCAEPASLELDGRGRIVWRLAAAGSINAPYCAAELAARLEPAGELERDFFAEPYGSREDEKCARLGCAREYGHLGGHSEPAE